MKPYELVARVHRLAPPSQTALKLGGMLGRPVIGNDDIVEVLKHDTVLTAKLLRACNAPFYGFAEPVSSIDQAVLILGHQQIRYLVFSLSFNSMMAAPLPGYAVEADELWGHSLVTAVACEKLAADGLPVAVDPAVAFTAGLLHDIGKLVLNEVLTADYQAAIRSRIHQDQRSRTEAEQDVIGTDHAKVGARLLEQWRLPAVIVEAVSNHHDPVLQPSPQLSTVVHFANCLAHALGSAIGWDAFAVRVAADSGALNLTPERIEAFLADMHGALPGVKHLQNLS